MVCKPVPDARIKEQWVDAVPRHLHIPTFLKPGCICNRRCRMSPAFQVAVMWDNCHSLLVCIDIRNSSIETSKEVVNALGKRARNQNKRANML